MIADAMRVVWCVQWRGEASGHGGMPVPRSDHSVAPAVSAIVACQVG